MRAREQRVVEEDPGFVEDEQRGSTVEPRFEAMEEIGQHRGDDTGLSHQRLRFEALDIGKCQLLFGGVEQPAVRPVERVRLQRGAQRVRLEQ